MRLTAVGQPTAQPTGFLAVAVWTAILTFIMIELVGTAGLRVSEEVEIERLDITVHGERWAAARCTVDFAAAHCTGDAPRRRRLVPCLSVSAAPSRSSC